MATPSSPGMLSVVALSATACAQDEVTLALDWFPNANHTACTWRWTAATSRTRGSL